MRIIILAMFMLLSISLFSLETKEGTYVSVEEDGYSTSLELVYDTTIDRYCIIWDDEDMKFYFYEDELKNGNRIHDDDVILVLMKKSIVMYIKWDPEELTVFNIK